MDASAECAKDSHTDRSSVDSMPLRDTGDQTQALPDDPEVLRAWLLAVWAERDALEAERDSIAVERDDVAAARNALEAERDSVATERDALAAHRAGATPE